MKRFVVPVEYISLRETNIYVVDADSVDAAIDLVIDFVNKNENLTIGSDGRFKDRIYRSDVIEIENPQSPVQLVYEYDWED